MFHAFTALLFSSCTATFTLIAKVSWLMFHLAISSSHPFSFFFLFDSCLFFFCSTKSQKKDLLYSCCWVGSLHHTKLTQKRSTFWACRTREFTTNNLRKKCLFVCVCVLELFSLVLEICLKCSFLAGVIFVVASCSFRKN